MSTPLVTMARRLTWYILQHRGLLDQDSINNVDLSLSNIKHFLREAALISSDPPCRPPALVPAKFRDNGLGGRPSADIKYPLLRDLTRVYGGAAKIATLLGFHPRTIRRHQLRWGLVQPGSAPFQVEYVDEEGRAHWRHCASRPTMTAMTDAELDEAVSDILRDFPDYGRGMIFGALVSQGLRVSRERVDASRLRVHGPPPPFRQRTIAHIAYRVPGANSLWHHDGNHSELPFPCFPRPDSIYRLLSFPDLIRWKVVLHLFVDGDSRAATGIGAHNNNRPLTVLHLFLGSITRWGTPSRLRGDCGLENLYVAQWMENYRGVIRNSYIWGRYVRLYAFCTPCLSLPVL